MIGERVIFHLADFRQAPRTATVTAVSDCGKVVDLDLPQGPWKIPVYGVPKMEAIDPISRNQTYYTWEPENALKEEFEYTGGWFGY